MNDLQCSHCGRAVEGLDGCVMTDRARYESPGGTVDELFVVCNACRAREPGLEERLIKLWELEWLRSRYVWVTRSFLQGDGNGDGDGDRARWGGGAVRQFVRLGSIVLPEQARPPSGAPGGAS